MSSYDAKKIEEYQLILLKNPRSKVFAALAETYRKMGMHSEALETTHKGLQYNPDYVSGLVAQARVLYDMNLFDQAVPSLEKALGQKPENLLARRLLAHCHIKLKNHSAALKAYKNLLFFNPSDEKAAQFVKKWEFIEAQGFEYEEPLIDPENIKEWVASLPSPAELMNVVDSYFSKEDFFTAAKIVHFGELKWPLDKEIQRRKTVIQSQTPTDPILAVSKQFWEEILQRVERRKNIDPFA